VNARAGREPWAIALVFVAVFSLALFRIVNYDIWFLLKAGDLILETGRVPTSDPFSYTSLGTPWVMHEWLFCVIAELVRRHLGLALLVVLKAIIVAAAFSIALTAATIRTKLGSGAMIVTATFVALGACASRFRFLARPHVVNFAGLAVFLLVLELFYINRRKWLLLLPPVTLVWANMQAGAIIGPAYLWLMFGSDLVSAKFGRQPKPKADHGGRRALFLVALASTGALFVNPYGLRILDFATAAIAEHGAGGGISVMEWTTPGVRFKLFWALFAVVWVVFLGSIGRWRMRDALALLFASSLAVMARRYVPIFFLLVTPSVGHIASQWSVFAQDARWRSRARLLLQIAAVGAFAICMVATFARPSAFVPGVGVNLGAYPVGGVNFIVKHNIYGNMYNSHRFGGYIIFRTYPGRKVFIDGRNVVHKSLWEKFATEPFEQIADEYRVDYALLDYKFDSRRRQFSAQSVRRAAMPPRSAQAERLLAWWRRHNGWHLVFWDDICAVYVDGSDKFQAVRRRFEYRFIDPTVSNPVYLAGYLSNARTRKLVLDEARRAIRQSPNSASCRILYDWVVARAKAMPLVE